MASLNRVTLIGNLGRDPESKQTSSGDKMTLLALATTESWKDRSSGENKEKTEWHNIVLYRQLADIAAEHLIKGSPVFIEGKIETKKYTDKNGIEKYATQIVATDLKLICSKPENGTRSIPGRFSPNRSRSNQSQTGFDEDDNAIPF